MSAATDRLLRLAATGSREKVIDLASQLSANIDGAERDGDVRMAGRWREFSRVVDAMAALRFPDWDAVSPARQHDRVGAVGGLYPEPPNAA